MKYFCVGSPTDYNCVIRQSSDGLLRNVRCTDNNQFACMGSKGKLHSYFSFKVLHPTSLYMQKYFQMSPAVNIYTHEYTTTSKYHMLPTHLRGENSTQKICFITIGLHGNLHISQGKTTKHAKIFGILADMQILLSFR